jgi:hypothetical protein
MERVFVVIAVAKAGSGGSNDCAAAGNHRLDERISVLKGNGNQQTESIE